MTLGKEIFFKKNLFAECQAGWHSAKNFLKKILCRVPDRGHSAKGGFNPAGPAGPHTPHTRTHARRQLPVPAPPPLPPVPRRRRRRRKRGGGGEEEEGGREGGGGRRRKEEEEGGGGGGAPATTRSSSWTSRGSSPAGCPSTGTPPPRRHCVASRVA